MGMLVARCPNCGAVDVPGAGVVVVLAGGKDCDGRWGFVCPSCGVLVWHTLCPEVREFLGEKGAVEVEVPGARVPAVLRPMVARRPAVELLWDVEGIDTGRLDGGAEAAL